MANWARNSMNGSPDPNGPAREPSQRRRAPAAPAATLGRYGAETSQPFKRFTASRTMP
jgi:hypothetical protein